MTRRIPLLLEGSFQTSQSQDWLPVRNPATQELLAEVQDAFLEEDGELPPVAALAERFEGRVPQGVLHCVRAALQAELEV